MLPNRHQVALQLINFISMNNSYCLAFINSSPCEIKSATMTMKFFFMLGIMLQSDSIRLMFINFQFQWTNNIKPTHTVGNHNQIQSTADNAPLSLCCSSHIVLSLPLNLNYVPPERDIKYMKVNLLYCYCCFLPMLLFGFKFKYFISSRMLTWEWVRAQFRYLFMFAY